MAAAKPGETVSWGGGGGSYQECGQLGLDIWMAGVAVVMANVPAVGLKEHPGLHRTLQHRDLAGRVLARLAPVLDLATCEPG